MLERAESARPIDSSLTRIFSCLFLLSKEETAKDKHRYSEYKIKKRTIHTTEADPLVNASTISHAFFFFFRGCVCACVFVRSNVVVCCCCCCCFKLNASLRLVFICSVAHNCFFPPFSSSLSYSRPPMTKKKGGDDQRHCQEDCVCTQQINTVSSRSRRLYRSHAHRRTYPCQISKHDFWSVPFL